MPTKRTERDDGSAKLAEFASAAVAAFQADDKTAYAALVKRYEGNAAVVGVFGIGAVTVAVSKGEVLVNPEGDRGGAEPRGRGAVYAETLAAIADGKMTVLDAYHRSELVARAPSETLHEAYDVFCKHADSALKSKRLRGAFEEFRKYANV